MRSVYKLRSRRAWSLVMLRTSSKLRVRSLARGLIAMLSISLFMIMEPAAKHWTGTSRDNIIMHREFNCFYDGTLGIQKTQCVKKKIKYHFVLSQRKVIFSQIDEVVNTLPRLQTTVALPSCHDESPRGT